MLKYIKIGRMSVRLAKEIKWAKMKLVVPQFRERSKCCLTFYIQYIQYIICDNFNFDFLVSTYRASDLSDVRWRQTTDDVDSGVSTT